VNCERADRVVRRFALVTLVLPVVVTTVGLMVQLAVLPQAPPRIPMYWGGSGAPSGWGPVWLPLVLTVVLGFGLPAVFGLSSLPSLRRGDRSPAFRIFGAQALGLSVLTVVATSLRLQNVGTTSSDENRLWLPLFAAGVAAALAGWFLQPRGSRPAPARAVTPLELASSERAAWIRTAFLPVPAVAVITAAATIVALKAGFGWVAGDRHGFAAILTAVALADCIAGNDRGLPRAYRCARSQRPVDVGRAAISRAAAGSGLGRGRRRPLAGRARQLGHPSPSRSSDDRDAVDIGDPRHTA